MPKIQLYFVIASDKKFLWLCAYSRMEAIEIAQAVLKETDVMNLWVSRQNKTEHPVIRKYFKNITQCGYVDGNSNGFLREIDVYQLPKRRYVVYKSRKEKINDILSDE